MGMHGHAFGAAASVTGAHIVAMYAPSLVTGDIIGRAGAVPVMLGGTAMLLACAGVALAGVTVAHFWLALVLLGIGWNCLYVGATSLITTSYRPSEKAKAQGANEIAIFLTMVSSSTASGLLLERGGWTAISWISVPFVLMAASLLVWLAVRQRQERLMALARRGAMSVAEHASEGHPEPGKERRQQDIASLT
jgi:MFS family permease